MPPPPVLERACKQKFSSVPAFPTFATDVPLLAPVSAEELHRDLPVHKPATCGFKSGGNKRTSEAEPADAPHAKAMKAYDSARPTPIQEGSRSPEPRLYRRPPVLPLGREWRDPPVLTGPPKRPASPPVPGQPSSSWLGTVHEEEPANGGQPATGGDPSAGSSS